MASLPKLVRLKCPRCAEEHWKIDVDYRLNRRLKPRQREFLKRLLGCPACNHFGIGFRVQETSPPLICFRQGSDHYPMTVEEFAHWRDVVKMHFPDGLIQMEAPSSPEEANARRVRRGLDPIFVRVMRDGRHGTSCREPTLDQALAWLDQLTRRSDSLTLVRVGGGELQIMGSTGTGFSICCSDVHECVLARSKLRRDRHDTQLIIQQYMSGETESSVETIQDRGTPTGADPRTTP